jgi:hypothetical protein
MLKHLDNINVLVPDNFLSFMGRRYKLKAKLNVSFSYKTPDDVEVFWITATPLHLRNIHMTKELVDYVEAYANEYVKSMFEVETYEMQSI